MCITFWLQHQWNGPTHFPFVIAFNRDEDVGRGLEAGALQFQDHHHSSPNIVCGIDKRTGTTWFAFNKKTGRFACLTNYRTKRNSEQQLRHEPLNPLEACIPRKYESRGALVIEYVKIGDPDIFEGDQ